jgi:hypothetical protein
MASVILKVNQKIACGAYSDVFRGADGKVVYKVFTSNQHPTNVSQDLTSPEDDARRRKTFLSECEAYRRASEHPFLRKHIPQFFRPCTVEDVRDSSGTIANLYLLDHCYALEYIAGRDTKIGELRIGGLPDHIEAALKAFAEIGIGHVIDASVFLADDPKNFKFIDFAIEEFQPEWR